MKKKQQENFIVEASRFPLGHINITTYKPEINGGEVIVQNFKVIDNEDIYTVQGNTFKLSKNISYIVIEKKKLIMNTAGGQFVLSCLYLDNDGNVRGWTR